MARSQRHILRCLLGTASVYASLLLATRYILGRHRYLYFTAVVTAIPGLCHPFEARLFRQFLKRGPGHAAKSSR